MKSDSIIGVPEMPEGLDRPKVERILEEVRELSSTPGRIDRISERLLGSPYVEGALGGGVDIPEVLRISLEDFDCVTYVETVVSLARSRTIDEFVDTVRQIRYSGGKSDWFHRNHYMIDWARNNEAGGFVASVSGAGMLEKACRLELIPGLPARSESFRYFPKPGLSGPGKPGETGDLMLFVSEKETLDVFHTGILIERGSALLMRHASRTAGEVIQQELVEFLNDNQMAGFILLKPLCRP